jgi:RNA polymerase primary sigma factor
VPTDAALSREEEVVIARRIRKGDQSALQILLEAHQRFAFVMAKRYGGYGADQDDLVQEANVALILAARRFDPERGVRFTTYAAWWIEAQLRRFLSGRNSMVKMSDRTRGVSRKLRRAEEQLLQQQHQSVTLQMVARSEDIDVRKAVLALSATNARVLSLDQPQNFGDETTLLDSVADDTSEQDFAQAEAQAVVTDALTVLKGRKREIIRLRYYENRSYAYIAEKLIISISRVREVEAIALSQLRRRVIFAAAPQGTSPANHKVIHPDAWTSGQRAEAKSA